MQGFSNWRHWLERAFPKGEDFASLLAEQARLTAESVGIVSAQIRGGALDIEATDAAFVLVSKQADHNLEKLSRAFSTPFDREDIYRAIGELRRIAEYVDHAVREMSELRVASEPAIVGLAATLEGGTQTLADAFASLGGDRAKALALANEAADTAVTVRRQYETSLGRLLVDGADPIDALRRREVYHHLEDGGKRIWSCAQVLSSVVIKDPR